MAQCVRIDCSGENIAAVFTDLASSVATDDQFTELRLVNAKPKMYNAAEEAAVDRFLRAVRGSAKLRHLSISGLGSRQAAALATMIHHNKSLIVLDLEGSEIGGHAGESVIRKLAYNKTLRALRMTHGAFGGADARVLGAVLCKNTTLRVLDLSGSYLVPGHLIDDDPTTGILGYDTEKPRTTLETLIIHSTWLKRTLDHAWPSPGIQFSKMTVQRGIKYLDLRHAGVCIADEAAARSMLAAFPDAETILLDNAVERHTGDLRVTETKEGERDKYGFEPIAWREFENSVCDDAVAYLRACAADPSCTLAKLTLPGDTPGDDVLYHIDWRALAPADLVDDERDERRRLTRHSRARCMTMCDDAVSRANWDVPRTEMEGKWYEKLRKKYPDAKPDGEYVLRRFLRKYEPSRMPRPHEYRRGADGSEYLYGADDEWRPSRRASARNA